MSFQWVAAGTASQIVEFHNIRADRGRRDELLSLPAQPGTAARFRVTDAPDQFVTLCGFADAAERRALLARHYADPAWPALRRRSADLIADESVHLMRCLSPGGLRLGPSPRPYVALIS